LSLLFFLFVTLVLIDAMPGGGESGAKYECGAVARTEKGTEARAEAGTEAGAGDDDCVDGSA
ncbi:hypothetical protein AVEN_271347-1, partial [Araneus ventricosus]